MDEVSLAFANKRCSCHNIRHFLSTDVGFLGKITDQIGHLNYEIIDGMCYCV